MTAPSLNVNPTGEENSKRIIVYKGFSENCSTNKSESKRSIVNKTLSQKNSANGSKYTITEKKDEDYKESLITKEV